MKTAAITATTSENSTRWAAVDAGQGSEENRLITRPPSTGSWQVLKEAPVRPRRPRRASSSSLVALGLSHRQHVQRDERSRVAAAMRVSCSGLAGCPRECAAAPRDRNLDRLGELAEPASPLEREASSRQTNHSMDQEQPVPPPQALEDGSLGHEGPDVLARIGIQSWVDRDVPVSSPEAVAVLMDVLREPRLVGVEEVHGHAVR